MNIHGPVSSRSAHRDLLEVNEISNDVLNPPLIEVAADDDIGAGVLPLEGDQQVLDEVQARVASLGRIPRGHVAGEDKDLPGVPWQRAKGSHHFKLQRVMDAQSSERARRLSEGDRHTAVRVAPRANSSVAD